MAITNVLSNNAAAVLFTPIGYQTNLLVMGPGNYTFADFVRFGLPLSGLIWITFVLFAIWWFGL